MNRRPRIEEDGDGCPRRQRVLLALIDRENLRRFVQRAGRSRRGGADTIAVSYAGRIVESGPVAFMERSIPLADHPPFARRTYTSGGT